MSLSPISRRRLACAVAACGLFTLNACGSDGTDDSSATTSARPTSTARSTTTSATTTRPADKPDREEEDRDKDAAEEDGMQRGSRTNSNLEDKEIPNRVVRVPGRADAHPDEGHAAPAEEDQPKDAPAEPAPAAEQEAPIEAPGATTEKETYFASCSEAPGPLLPHQAGYRSGLDSDGDGVACEPDENNIADAATGPTGGYESCKAAREAGATPLREGDPGYNPDLDKDGDGVACER
ncbi:excalibur calcium-binding domain-containing protein [Corynebacterium mastitidis]|uniref:Excalibur calcium-binding domain-containing protein n=1 Tax=Corynebacterium mastitidis TaxID=161890 RepID=A0ABU8P1E8_9CORY